MTHEQNQVLLRKTQGIRDSRKNGVLLEGIKQGFRADLVALDSGVDVEGQTLYSAGNQSDSADDHPVRLGRIQGCRQCRER